MYNEKKNTSINTNQDEHETENNQTSKDKTNQTDQNKLDNKQSGQTKQPFTQEEWSSKRTRLQEEYPDLTDEDLEFEEGKHTELFDRLQTKLGKTKDELRKIIDGYSEERDEEDEERDEETEEDTDQDIQPK